MTSDGFYESRGEGRIHFCVWEPREKPRAVVQIIHGISEIVERYDEFARYLNELGFLVVGEDHMGHGKSIHRTAGFFAGGWITALQDSLTLHEMVRKKYPDLPYVMLGHSMGSYMLRTILCLYPERKLDGAIIMGTGWEHRQALAAAETLCRSACRKVGERAVSPVVEKAFFGSYNRKIEHQRTKFDWLTRDQRIVDAYIAHPRCGLPATAGLYRDLVSGLQILEDRDQMQNMKKTLPVLFVSGAMDPVGNYGKGVERSFEEFKKAGMQDVKMKLYPLCRHEILNELNRKEVYGDIGRWLSEKLPERNRE